MEEMHRTHKEPAWGWVADLKAGLAARPRKTAPGTAARPKPCPDGGVVTPWDRHAPCGWSA